MNRLVVTAVIFSILILSLPVVAVTPDPVLPTDGVLFTPNTAYSVHAEKTGYSNSPTYTVVTA